MRRDIGGVLKPDNLIGGLNLHASEEPASFEPSRDVANRKSNLQALFLLCLTPSRPRIRGVWPYGSPGHGPRQAKSYADSTHYRIGPHTVRSAASALWLESTGFPHIGSQMRNMRAPGTRRRGRCDRRVLRA